MRRSPIPVVATRVIGGVATCRDRMRNRGQLTPAPITRTATAAAATLGTRQPGAGAAGAAGSLAVMRSLRQAHSSSVRQARRSGGVLLTLWRRQLDDPPAIGRLRAPRIYGDQQLAARKLRDVANSPDVSQDDSVSSVAGS